MSPAPRCDRAIPFGQLNALRVRRVMRLVDAVQFDNPLFLLSVHTPWAEAQRLHDRALMQMQDKRFTFVSSWWEQLQLDADLRAFVLGD